MSASPVSGGPAFPVIETIPRDVGAAGSYTTIGDTFSHGGMTLRDYFAAKAMQGMVASEWMIAHTNAMVDSGVEFHRATWVAEQAYAFADAMLAAREGATP